MYTPFVEPEFQRARHHPEAIRNQLKAEGTFYPFDGNLVEYIVLVTRLILDTRAKLLISRIRRVRRALVLER